MNVQYILLAANMRAKCWFGQVFAILSIQSIQSIHEGVCVCTYTPSGFLVVVINHRHVSVSPAIITDLFALQKLAKLLNTLGNKQIVPSVRSKD